MRGSEISFLSPFPQTKLTDGYAAEGDIEPDTLRTLHLKTAGVPSPEHSAGANQVRDARFQAHDQFLCELRLGRIARRRVRPRIAGGNCDARGERQHRSPARAAIHHINVGATTGVQYVGETLTIGRKFSGASFPLQVGDPGSLPAGHIH